MRIVRYVLAGAMMAALAACSGNTFPLGNTYITDQLDAAEAVSPQGSAFNQALHSEYMWVSRTMYASGEGAWAVGSLNFKDKALAAASGDQVDPISPSALAVDDSELNEAHKRLMAALDKGGAEKAPADMARAQAAYDCWIFAACNKMPSVAEECKARFLDAIAAVEKALAPAGPPPARDYIVFFDFDSAAVRPDAAQVLNEVLGATSAMEGSKVYATGHADRSGSRQYNLGLSERRAVSVRDYLVNGGLGSYRIFIDWKGEDDPRVPTPDGVREQENRRVEIKLQ